MSFLIAIPSLTFLAFEPAMPKRKLRKAKRFSDKSECNSFSFLFFKVFLGILDMARNYFGAYRQFGAGLAQGLASHRIRHAVNFKNYPSRLDRSAIAE